MFKGLPVLVLPKFPKFAKISSKIALGVVSAIFFSGYQPALQIPPVSKSETRAQAQQTQNIQVSQLPISFQLPHPGYLSTKYSTYHPGIDLATGLGMPVKPISGGTVADTGYSFIGYGLMVVIDHGHGYKSLYAHLGKTYVKKNQQIGSDNYIGEVGLTGHTTGPHTHLEVLKDGKNVDPLAYLPTITPPLPPQ